MAGAARLIVLGSGTAIPLADRTTSCYLVDDGEGHVLLVDIGPGALARAARVGYGLSRLDSVLVTHVHPDHCTDLVSLLFALGNPLAGRRDAPVTVLGHAAVGLLLSRLRNAWPRWLAVGASRFEFVSVQAGPVGRRGCLQVSAHRVAHHASSLGFRLRWPDGFVLAFSGDAAEGADLLALARQADLLVLEAAVPVGRPVPGHLDPLQAGRIAAQAGVGQLLLTHFYPPVLDTPILDQVREGFEGRVTLAQDGQIVPLGR